MTRPVSDAASNSHPVAAFFGRTNTPLASGEGSGGRDHSLLRLFQPLRPQDTGEFRANPLKIL